MKSQICARERPEAQPPAAEPDKPVEADKPKQRLSPLQLILKDGIPAHGAKRARMRDDLYALLATSGEEKEAKRIARAIERVWLTSGSDTVSVLMERAIRAIKAKQQELALELLNAVVDLAPDYAEGWNRRAYVNYKLNDLRSAVGDLRRVLALDPQHYKALDGLGTILQETGNEIKAYEVYKRLREVHPFWPGVDKIYQDLKRKVEGRGI